MKKVKKVKARRQKRDRTHWRVIAALYHENDYPTDRLIGNPHALVGFTAELSRRTDHHWLASEVAKHLVAMRQQKKLQLSEDRTFSGPKFVHSGKIPHSKPPQNEAA